MLHQLHVEIINEIIKDNKDYFVHNNIEYFIGSYNYTINILKKENNTLPKFDFTHPITKEENQDKIFYEEIKIKNLADSFPTKCFFTDQKDLEKYKEEIKEIVNNFLNDTKEKENVNK